MHLNFTIKSSFFVETNYLMSRDFRKQFRHIEVNVTHYKSSRAFVKETQWSKTCSWHLNLIAFLFFVTTSGIEHVSGAGRKSGERRSQKAMERERSEERSSGAGTERRAGVLEISWALSTFFVSHAPLTCSAKLKLVRTKLLAVCVDTW